jgi:hypothetical protein
LELELIQKTGIETGIEMKKIRIGIGVDSKNTNWNWN